MKHFIVLIVMVASVLAVHAQDNPRPTKSRFWKSKLSTFVVKPGDILVYELSDSTGSSTIQVNVTNFGNHITYEYEPAPQKFTAITMDAAAVSTGTEYGNLFGESRHPLWLSRKNYKELASIGVTSMDFGTGASEYTRHNTGTLKINYKGKEKIITLYNVSSENGAQTLGILTDEKNPLVVTAHGHKKLALKEVR